MNTLNSVSKNSGAKHYVQKLLVERAPGVLNIRRIRSPEKVRAWLDSLTQFSDRIPQLPEEAFKRESFIRMNRWCLNVSDFTRFSGLTAQHPNGVS